MDSEMTRYRKLRQTLVKRGTWVAVATLTTVLFVFLFSCRSGESNSQNSSEIERKSREWAERVAQDTVAKIRKGHPRIYLTPERIPELRKQAVTSKAAVFELMKKRTGGKQAALFYALGSDSSLKLAKSPEEYGRIAAEALLQSVRENNRRTSPDDLAVLYDWANDALTREEKQAFVDFCKLRIGTEVRVHEGKSHGYRAAPHPLGIIAALSFYGDGIDDAYAKRLLIQGLRDTLLDNLAMEHSSGSEGGFSDGTYYIFQLGKTFYPFLAVSTATGTDFLLEHDVLTRLPNHLLRVMLPFTIERAGNDKKLPYFATFHDNWTTTTKDYGSSGAVIANLLTITAAEFSRHGDDKTAGLYTWFVKEAFGGIPYQAADPLSFVLMKWDIQPRSPQELGLQKAEALGWNEGKGRIDRDRFGKKAGIGWVSMRSAWDDPDATFALFKAEPFYYHGHMHHASLAFMIAKGEELALARAGNYMCWYEGGPVGSRDPGWPQMENFFSRTVSTSNLLVYDPKEKFDGWANDGGQRLTPYWDNKWGRTYNGTADGNYRDIGGLTRFERHDDYVYAAADATRAYNSALVTTGNNRAKVSLVQREFVYLPSPGGDNDYFVIFDRVESVRPELKKLWLLQLRAKPEFDGSHRVVLGTEAGGVHQSDKTALSLVRQERASLSSKTLLPKNGNRITRRLGGSISTRLLQPLGKNDNGPLDIKVESTVGMPNHPTVIITAHDPVPNREVFDRYSVWPQANHASGLAPGERICYFCEGKTPASRNPAKLLGCKRAVKSSPGFDMPVGASVIQEFRHMGVEGVDTGNDAERVNYPWGYGYGYGYGDGNQYGLWRIEVSPKKPAKLDNFLHVLHPTLKKNGGDNAELIESAGDNLYGARIGNRAVLFSRTAEPLDAGSYGVRGSGVFRHLLCNLRPGARYRFTLDGKPLATLKAGMQGTLRFDTMLHGGESRVEFKRTDA